MAKSQADFIQAEEIHAISSFHKPDSKGRQKQNDQNMIRNYESFGDWDDLEIETFQKFNRRSKH